MKLLSELERVFALVEKATPGELSVYDANEGDGWPPRPLWCFKNEAYDSDDEAAQPLQGSVHYGGKEDAEAIAAAVNLLRQHGPAIAAALRAVEGAVAYEVEACEFEVAPEEFDLRGSISCAASFIGQRVALVPLDAADDGSGG